jgi:hypothetical protein
MSTVNDDTGDHEVDAILEYWHDKGYRVEQTLDHNDIVPFIVGNLKKLNPVTFFFYLANAAGLIFLITFVYLHFQAVSIWQILLSMVLGALLILPLVPVHELLHGIAYKISGAKAVTYGANWQQLYFTASAHLFVAGYLKFLFVGLLPFIVINLFGFYAIWMLPAQWGIMILFCLVLHNTMCAGDFGIIGYFHENRKGCPVTFDDVNKQLSYFLVREDN